MPQDDPVAAAAQGQIFSLVIFGLAFGIAIARLPRKEDAESPILGLLAHISQAMMTIVDWVLVVVPVGIFLLALGLGLSSGLGIAQVLGAFVALCFATTLLMTALCYEASCATHQALSKSRTWSISRQNGRRFGVRKCDKAKT